MKALGAQIASFLSKREMRQNVHVLAKYIAFLCIVILVSAVLFHFIMLHVEGERHSWITGIYWVLTVMSTLGFGDITFSSDVGRAFSILVLLSGVILFLIVLPFLFIRYLYAPWLETQLQLRGQPPRSAPAGTRGHVVICRYDTIAERLVDRLRFLGIPYFVVEGDVDTARRLHAEGISVVAGDVDARATYEALQVEDAALVLANDTDTTNTNIILTVREAAPRVPIAAIARASDSIDILELAGATNVLPLKRQLGEHLANRVNAGTTKVHVFGCYRNLQIAEFAVHNTPFAGKTLRETQFRAVTGASIVGIWERGRLIPAGPDVRLTQTSVPIIVGTAEQIQAVNELLVIYDSNDNPVIVVGGGKVGRAAVRALKRMGIAVHLVERDASLQASLEGLPDRLFIGDAADRDVLLRAGLAEAPSVLLTTHDDGVNIYLAVYCRRLNPDLRIVSRITHQRNVEAVHRAGADLVLGYDSLGVESALSILERRELLVLGGGLDLFRVPLPDSLAGMSLAEGGIGARTGLTVVAVEAGGRLVTNPRPSTVLRPGSELLMLGTSEQCDRFAEAFR